jgi:hypothetical protein
MKKPRERLRGDIYLVRVLCGDSIFRYRAALRMLPTVRGNRSRVPLSGWSKRRHRDERPNQAQRCLLFWTVSAAQELAEVDMR